MKELKKVRRFVYNCKKCGVCGNKVSAKVPYVCPVRHATPGFEHFYSRGKIIIAQGLLEGRLEPAPGLAEALYSCTLCGNCMTQCGTSDADTGAPLVATTKIVEAMRADMLREHPAWVDQAYHGALTSSRQYENPWGLPRASREKWSKGLDLVDASKEPVEVLLFTGCTMPSTPVLADRARAAVRILQQAGIRPGTLGKNEVCCGSVQRKIGDFSLADDLMRKNTQLLNSTGCKKIVTLCAGCYNTLHNEYAAAETPLAAEVYHFVSFLAELIREKKITLQKRQQLKVAYHDPCHLGRHAGIFNPPRDILKAIPGIELIERRASREHTICCGAGGGMRLFANGSLATAIGTEAVREAQRAGAQAIVSACPFCELNLTAASQGLREPLPVYDIVDLVYASLEGAPGA